MTNEELLQIVEQAAREGQRKLDLSGKNLTSLPPEIGQVQCLTWLDLSNNKLTSLPAEISQLKNLTWLDLSRNQFRSLSQRIGRLENLTWLNLSYNRLTHLPIGITRLKGLTWLYLDGNYLKNLPAKIGQLQTLSELHLRNNQLSDLPGEIIQLQNLAEIDLNGNQLNLPVDILAQSQQPNTILDFYKQLQEQEDYLYEAKLLIVGEGGAGKTSLAKKIQNEQYQLQQNEESTIGIDINYWSYTEDNKQFRVNIWDFSGQEIDYATHQFFLTEQSLYLLVADNRREDTNFFYWLGVVELQSKNSPLLIIKNEKQGRQREINELQLRGRFKNLKDILATDLTNNQGLQEIVAEIKHQVRHLPHIGKPLPKTWIKVREALERDTRNYISQQEFFSICQGNGFTEQQAKLQLSQYLHYLGVCLHFQDDLLLSETIILKPTWITNAVYKVLNNDRIISNQGRFNQEDLVDIWHEAEYANMRSNLLQLMLNFKLCYKLPENSGAYLAPQLLNFDQPKHEWEESDNLVLRYKYRFMPKGILAQFIVEMSRLVHQDWAWRNGVILYEDQTKAKVVEHCTNYSGEISVRVSGQRKRDLLTTIDYEFDKIHGRFSNLRYEKLVPCNCPVCRTKLKPNFYEFNKLRERTVNGKLTIECDYPPYHEVNILSLIDDVNLSHLLQASKAGEGPVINIQVHTGSGDNAAGNKNTTNN